MNAPAEDTFSVYVHFPYCEVRCTYCDFNTYVVEQLPIKAYSQAVMNELELRRADYEGWELSSIYFGGGTPSLWGPSGVHTVIEQILATFPRHSPHIEVTMECNPGEAQAELLAEYQAIGVERLSLGVQSLDDTLLATLHRRHSAAGAINGLKAALRAGFRSVSADLMFGLPGQSLDRFKSDLSVLGELGVDHLSVYHLMLEPGTAMTRDVQAGRIQLPNDDLQADMWECIGPTLAPYGLRFYEISNLSRPGHESRHNTAYWMGRPYLGLGAGAHSFCPPLDWHEVGAMATRRENLKHHRNYTRHLLHKQDRPEKTEAISKELHVRERVFTGLRHLPGVDLATISKEVGVDVMAFYADTIGRLVELGLLQQAGSKVALTARGMTFADTVAEQFF